MYSLLIHQRYVEFWRDMWFILLQPISELPPGPSSFEQDTSQKPPVAQPIDDRPDLTKP